jgi:hypothetical protein
VIAPADDYVSRNARLRSYGGIAETAWCEIVPAAGQERLPASRWDGVGDVITALSLALGSHVAWHYSVERDAAERITDVVHHAGYAGPSAT